ncbi:MAG: porin [Betaproteobacteria bacterium]|nr:MAG: porin [Betaproteobacteria bacterium]
MKKLFLASAVSALFAAPATVLAQAKPAPVPTLDKVLEASGISVSGYIDAGYTHSDRNQAAFSTRVFDQENNSFALRQFGLQVAKQPKEGFGGLVNLTVGKDAQVIHSFPEGVTTPPTPASATSMFDVTQAFLQYAGGPLTLIAGKFVTLQGSEVIWSPTNPNASRSILFGAIPFTHTGVRATWAVSDTVSLIAGVNNGWDQLTDANKGKTVELGATLNPIKPLSITLSGYSGQEVTSATTNGTRTSINAVASYTIIDPLSVGLEVLSVSQENAGGGTTKQKYSGVAGYVTYMFTPKFRGVIRAESFDDKDGFKFGTASTKYKEVTLTGAFLASDSFEARIEGRRDQATNTVFTDYAGVASKTMTSIALQGLYKF